MTILEHAEQINALDKIIYTQIKSSKENTYAICDGIIDLEKYSKAKYRILWILKEPYDSFDVNGKSFGGGWHIKDGINKTKTFREFERTGTTYGPMIYTSWGILNDFQLRETMIDVRKDHSMLEALKSTAYINVKKLPGNKWSTPSIIKNAYTQNREILLKQIECIDPQIIIGGRTLPLFFKDLGLTDMQKHGSIRFAIKDNKIYIDAFHPAYRVSTTGVSQQQYCNDIITAVQNWSTGSL